MAASNQNNETVYLTSLPRGLAKGPLHTITNWGREGVGGINGKRYAYQSPSSFYLNEDGTVYFDGKNIPITNINGNRYVDIEVPGKHSNYNIGHTYDHRTGTYQQGKTFYRFPIASTAPRPTPVVTTTEQQQETPEKEQEFYQVKIPFDIPQEDLQKIIATIPAPETSSKVTKTETQLNTGPTETSSDTEPKRYRVVQPNNPVNIQMWKYPTGKVNIINFTDEESQRLFQEKINQYKFNRQKGSVYQDYIYSNRPLTGALNDSTFVTYAYSPTAQKFEKVKEIEKPWTASIAKGEHTKDGVKNVIISNYGLYNKVQRSDSKVHEYIGERDQFQDITINPNLPFKYHFYKAEDPGTGLPYELLSYGVDYDYSDRQGPLRNPVIYRNNQSSDNSNTQTNVSTTQSANQNTTSEGNNTSESNTGIMNNVLSFFSKLKKQSGGIVNYFDQFK